MNPIISSTPLFPLQFKDSGGPSGLLAGSGATKSFSRLGIGPLFFVYDIPIVVGKRPVVALPGAPSTTHASVGIPSVPPATSWADVVHVSSSQVVVLGVLFFTAQYLNTTPSSKSKRGGK